MPIPSINNLVEIMREVGYDLPDLLPAFPGYDLAKLTDVQRDTGLALNRPYIGYGMLGVAPCRTAYFNVSRDGFRLPGADQPWPPSTEKFNIFLFGGSTAMGYYIPDKDTIAAQLEKCLSRHRSDISVYNFAGGSYTSREEALRFTQLVDTGTRIDLAVFLDGYNDAYYAYGNPALTIALDALYREEKRRRGKRFFSAVLDYALSMMKGPPHLSTISDRESISPNRECSDLLLPKDVLKQLARAADLDDLHTTPAEDRLAERIWTRYLDSFALIRGLAARHKIPIHAFLQPTPYYGCRPEQRIMERLFVRLAPGTYAAPFFRWLHARKFPGTQEFRFTDLSLAGLNQNGVLYLDICHYSPRFSEHLGALMAERLLPDINQRRPSPRSSSV